MNYPNRTERLQKFISRCGYTSRRKAELLIEEGKVKVNGVVITELGYKIDPTRDRIKVEKTLLEPETLVYYIFNKPKGVLSSLSDPQGRPTVVDYFKDVRQRIYPVGRLDYNTEGLLLLTNDGSFAQNLAHPSKGVNKTYQVKIKGRVQEEHLKELAQGVLLDGRKTALADIVDYGFNGTHHEVDITIHEGRNRQVRRMFELKGYSISNLKRIEYGPLDLKGLKRGSHRKLTGEEIKALKELS